MNKVVCTGGGSAGHVVPTLPVMEYLIARSWQVVYIGSRSGLEERLVKPLGVAFHSITTGKLRRYWSIENLLDCFRVPLGVVQAIRILRKEEPDVVFSKGGYVAFPIVVAAWLSRIPVVAHESDVSPGLANRLCFWFIHSLCVNFDSTHASVRRLVVTGTPIRKALLEGNAESGRERLGFREKRPIILVVGGSLGALLLNLLAFVPRVMDSHHAVHVAIERVRQKSERVKPTPAVQAGDVIGRANAPAVAAHEMLFVRLGKIAVDPGVAQHLRRADLIRLVPMIQQRHRIARLAQGGYRLPAGEEGQNLVVGRRGGQPGLGFVGNAPGPGPLGVGVEKRREFIEFCGASPGR